MPSIICPPVLPNKCSLIPEFIWFKKAGKRTFLLHTEAVLLRKKRYSPILAAGIGIVASEPYIE